MMAKAAWRIRNAQIQRFERGLSFLSTGLGVGVSIYIDAWINRVDRCLKVFEELEI
jgi:hypothetical protein